MLIYFIVLSLNNMVLNNADCNLGQIDFEAVQIEVVTTIQSKKKRGTCVVYTPKERFEIGKCAVENGT